MDSKKQSELLEKYWSGKTSLEEEKTLFSKDFATSEFGPAKHFDQLAAFKELSLSPDFEAALMDKISQTDAPVRTMYTSMLWKVAAAILLLAGSFYFITLPSEKIIEQPIAMAEEMEDAEKAFEITKQALLLVSANLNRASEINVGLDKFETTKAKIEMVGEKE